MGFENLSPPCNEPRDVAHATMSVRAFISDRLVRAQSRSWDQRAPFKRSCDGRNICRAMGNDGPATAPLALPESRSISGRIEKSAGVLKHWCRRVREPRVDVDCSGSLKTCPVDVRGSVRLPDGAAARRGPPSARAGVSRIPCLMRRLMELAGRSQTGPARPVNLIVPWRRSVIYRCPMTAIAALRGRLRNGQRPAVSNLCGH